MDIPPLQKLVDRLTYGSDDHARYYMPGDEVDRLERYLDGVSPTRSLHLSYFSHYTPPLPLPNDLRSRVEVLAPRVWDASLPSKGSVEEGILQHLAYTASPTSLPVFVDAIEFSRPRDKHAERRRQWGIVGVAFLVHRRRSAVARRALDGLLQHPDPWVSATAVVAVATLERKQDERLTSEGAARLEAAATSGRAFEARLLARVALLGDRRALPLDESGEVYQVTATFGGASRTLELLASATLTDLCAEVVRAFQWDLVHRWALHLSDCVDHSLLHLCPSGKPGADDDMMCALTLDEVGLPTGHKLKMHYDLRSSNVFTLRVVGRVSRSPGASYPRVVATKGSSPEPPSRP